MNILKKRPNPKIILLGGIFLSIVLLATILVGAEVHKGTEVSQPTFSTSPRLGKIGDYPFPTNPMNDRAKGYLFKGKVKSAVFNYGNFIQWGDYSSASGYNGMPAGMWGNYSYLPHVTFMAGVPGLEYSHKFNWIECESFPIGGGKELKIWCSTEAYSAWFANNDTNYVGIVFNVVDDRGVVGELVSSRSAVTKVNEWGFDHQLQEIFISIESSLFGSINPNSSRSLIGLIHPWGLRPALKERTPEFDVYDYGPDDDEWTADDNYAYYGATLTESWFTRWNPSTNTEWQAANKSRINSHNTEVTSGELFGELPYVDEDDPYPLLAHSNYSQTWPTSMNEETGEYEPYWPGWWSDNYDEDLPGCSQSRKDPDCWEQVPGRFVSDTDVYMEFDDRWTHRSNIVNTNDEYEQTGYPMGIRVKATAHSYGVAYAEDILFVTVKVRNESGDWVDEDGWHDGMIMPDGTKLNRSKGFDYKNVYLGFYMDADAVSADANGNFGVHTNEDDFMEYYWERFEVNNESMLISMAMIYDWDGRSGVARDIGIVATQLLDSPRATEAVDLDQDGTIDIFPGEPLKMTDWHWFDWYNRPGVPFRESNTNCCAGAQGKAQARNREEIQLKVLSGDTTNLSDDEKAWFFHTQNPDTDLDSELNPHFDSLEGLEEEPAFLSDPPGLDCVVMFACGPFDFDVGEEVPFSFCIIFGQDKTDLIQNARFAQIMYNSHYQGYTPPTVPIVSAETDHQQVTLIWDDASEYSSDVVTGYSDFEGYKIYKSTDGGKTWGGPDDKIYDDNNIFVGWHPVAQFDLTTEEDSLHCIFVNDDSCAVNRGHSIKGPDPNAPWFNLGADTGLPDKRISDGKYYWVDTDVIDGLEYTYSVTAYDMGVEAPFRKTYVDNGTGGFYEVVDTTSSNPNSWSAPDGYQYIENSRGTTIQDANFITVIPGFPAAQSLDNINVVPNPYIVRSGYNESEYIRKLLFSGLPQYSSVTIFTVTGEKVNSFTHTDATTGNEFWNLRSVNNQEIAPGLYIYVVEWEGKKHIGKFAVVR